MLNARSFVLALYRIPTLPFKEIRLVLNSDKNRDISCQMVLLGSMALLHSRDCYASPLNIIFLRKFDDHQNKPLGPVGQRLKPPKRVQKPHVATPETTKAISLFKHFYPKLSMHRTHPNLISG